MFPQNVVGNMSGIDHFDHDKIKFQILNHLFFDYLEKMTFKF